MKTPNGFTIRAAREADAASMVTLLNPIIEAGIYTSMTRSIALTEQVQFIRSFPAGGIFYVAVCQESAEVIGMQDIMPTDQAGLGEISTFVRRNQRGKGVGSALLQASLCDAQMLGYSRIVARIRRINRKAVGFYAHHGFANDGSDLPAQVILVRLVNPTPRA